MAKLRTMQSAMNAGELSPKLRGRTEIPRYQNGLEFSRNALPIVEGGATRAPGSRFIAVASGAVVRLIPFSETVDGALVGWMLEFGNELIRFYKDGALVYSGASPFVKTSPYGTADLAQLHYIGKDNTLYLFHPSYIPYRLYRGATDILWTLETLPFAAYPFQRPPRTETITLTPSATSGTITITSNEDFFSAAHIGLSYRINGGTALITAFTNAKTVTALLTQSIPVPAEMVNYTEVETITITKASLSGVTNVQFAFTTNKTADTADLQSIELELSTEFSPDPLPTGITQTTQSTYNVVAAFEVHTAIVTLSIDPVTLAADTVLELTAIAERKKDQGDGRNNISYNLTSTITDPLPAGVAVSSVSSWSPVTGTEADTEWEEIAWSALRGWPRCGSFFEQRLVLAGSLTYPTYVWGSKIAAKLDFTIGTLDDEGFSFPFAEATTAITHLYTLKKIFCFTFDKELTLKGDNGPLTPSSPTMESIGSGGSSALVNPLQIGSTIHFVSPSGMKLRGIEYSLERDGYTTPDQAVFASHLLEAGGGIIAMAYSREPDSIIWAVTANGHLLTLSLDKDQGMAAWARHYASTPHNYKDVAVVADSSGIDGIWQAVARFGQTFIEKLDYSLNSMAAVTASSTPAKTVWDGLDHLEGQTVDILANGFVAPPQVVTGGAITLTSPASTVEIGLNYTTVIKDLPLDMAQQSITAQGSNMQVAKIRVRLHKTSGCTINGERLPFQKFGPDLLDKPVVPFSGDKLVQNIGRGPEPEATQVTIIQDQPLPLTVLAIIKQVAIND